MHQSCAADGRGKRLRAGCIGQRPGWLAARRAFAPLGVPLIGAREDDKIDWMVELGGLLHGEMGWVLLACIVGHAVMAFWHRRPGHTDVMPRMVG